MSPELLPSWRPGVTRDALIEFLTAVTEVPSEHRVAVFDNDGTLWAERPVYVQQHFLVARLHDAAALDPALAERPEFAAVLDDDHEAMAAFGLPRVALALAELFAGLTPDEFATRAREFVMTVDHPTLGVPYARTTYRPMTELIDALRARDFSVFVVTGGGTEFVRAVSRELYGVDPEGVVGTLIEYEFDGGSEHPVLIRTGRVQGGAMEGQAKVAGIQQFLGRRPIFAAGNSGGDREMLEYTAAGSGPTLALLVDHDDPDREFAYRSEAATIAETVPITDVASAAGWTVASMQRDWSTVFSET